MPHSAIGIVRQRWDRYLNRDENGAPFLSPLFVLEQGTGVSVIDLRSSDDATGVLGYVPGSVFMSAESVARDLPAGSPLVFVSRTGKEAAQVALKLEQAGWPQVAAMAGGLVAWRKLGLKTSRDPTGIRKQPYAVHAAGDEGISLARVEEHIGDPRNVRWMKLASMVSYGSFSCIDGRDERGVVGTLGGDAGEFLLSLAALERATGTLLDEVTVSRALEAHTDAFGRFYMHTDAGAFERLVAALRGDPRLAANVDDLELDEDLVDLLRHPEPGLWESLLEHLVEPDHIGCGHLRLMLQHSDEYGIRRDLVVFYTRAFFRQWWDGTPELSLTILPGEHEEAAVLNIRLDEEIWGVTPIPLVSPTYRGRQMFVNHADVTSYLRDLVVRFHSEGLGGVNVPADSEWDLREALRDLGVQQLTTTLGYLAKGLPIYDVVFARDGSFTVRNA